jgi:hypothetical protein
LPASLDSNAERGEETRVLAASSHSFCLFDHQHLLLFKEPVSFAVIPVTALVVVFALCPVVIALVSQVLYRAYSQVLFFRFASSVFCRSFAAA